MPPFNLLPMMPSDTDFFTRLLGRLGTLRPLAAFP